MEMHGEGKDSQFVALFDLGIGKNAQVPFSPCPAVDGRNMHFYLSDLFK